MKEILLSLIGISISLAFMLTSIFVVEVKQRLKVIENKLNIK